MQAHLANGTGLGTVPPPPGPVRLRSRLVLVHGGLSLLGAETMLISNDERLTQRMNHR